MLHKTRAAIRFRAKKPSSQTNFALVYLWCGRAVDVRPRDWQIFSDIDEVSDE